MSASNGDELIALDDLEPRKVVVTRGSKRYLLNQATAGDACKMDAFRYRNAKVGEDGQIVHLESIADGPPYLVSLCLWEEGPPDGAGKPSWAAVPLDTILSWPPHQVTRLHDWITENSGMAPAETMAFLRERIKADQRKVALLERLGNGELAKNSPGATSAT